MINSDKNDERYIIDNIIKECCKINNIKFPILNNEKDIRFNNIFKLMTSTYSIFLTNKFYKKYYNFKKRLLLNYFDTYNIVYLNYNHRNDILNIIEIINKILDIYNKFIDSLKKIPNSKIYITGGLSKQYSKLNKTNTSENVIIMSDGYGSTNLESKPEYVECITQSSLNIYDIGCDSLEWLKYYIKSSDIIF